MERSIVVADLNGDGKLDVAVTSKNQFVSVALGDGTGKLGLATNSHRTGLNLDGKTVPQDDDNR